MDLLHCGPTAFAFANLANSWLQFTVAREAALLVALKRRYRAVVRRRVLAFTRLAYSGKNTQPSFNKTSMSHLPTARTITSDIIKIPDLYNGQLINIRFNLIILLANTYEIDVCFISFQGLAWQVLYTQHSHTRQTDEWSFRLLSLLFIPFCAIG